MINSYKVFGGGGYFYGPAVPKPDPIKDFFKKIKWKPTPCTR